MDNETRQRINRIEAEINSQHEWPKNTIEFLLFVIRQQEKEIETLKNPTQTC